MLHVIIDDDFEQPNLLSKRFYSSQTWQMNLMMATNKALGVAEMFALELGLEPGKWVVASPIQWQATHNDSMIIADFQEAIYHESLKKAFEKFKLFLAQDNITVYEFSSTHWVFSAKDMPEIFSPYLGEILHQSFFRTLIEMEPTWQRWLTEMQMLYANYNTQEAVNGLWPWGGGHFSLQCPVFKLENDAWPKYLGPLLVWDKNHKCQHGALLVSSHDSQRIQTMIDESVWRKYPVRFWWKNGYFDRKPLTIWEKFKVWIHYEN